MGRAGALCRSRNLTLCSIDPSARARHHYQPEEDSRQHAGQEPAAKHTASSGPLLFANVASRNACSTSVGTAAGNSVESISFNLRG